MSAIQKTGGIGTAAINSNYPVAEGLTAGTTKQTGERILTAEEGSNLTNDDLVGLS